MTNRLPDSALTSGARLSKREDVTLGTRVEELDLHGAVGTSIVATDEVVHARFADGAMSLGVDIYAVVDSRQPAVQQHAEADRSPGARRHHQVDVPRGE